MYDRTGGDLNPERLILVVVCGEWFGGGLGLFPQTPSYAKVSVKLSKATKALGLLPQDPVFFTKEYILNSVQNFGSTMQRQFGGLPKKRQGATRSDKK